VKVRTVTVDLWGTLFLDTPGSDNRYKARRLADFDSILRGGGTVVPMRRLERAYDDSGSYLGRVWATNRDVPVADHVRAILRALDRRVADAARADMIEALVEAYARPALLAPPAIDPTARPAFHTLCEAGVTLALVSNTMRTPGVILRKVLAGAGVLEFFAHTVFSDELGIRKPDPEIFWQALSGVSGDRATSVHVGDDAVLDVEGGRAAGLRVVQVVSRGGQGASQAADRTITCLGELPAAVSSLEAE
jgi:putative hydrolase of the HAD superfamily